MKRVAITYADPRKLPPYAEAVRDAGGESVPVCPADELRSLNGFSGLLLSGGSDLNPKLYGQMAEEHTQAPDDRRDGLELALLREALERDIPVLAICRGMQLFNIAHAGGTLLQHIEGHEIRTQDPSKPAHSILVRPATRLAKIAAEPTIDVNSRHHQAISNVGDQLIISAHAPDGIIEGLERPDRRFALAVQWHPEDQIRFSAQRRLFEAFVSIMSILH